jgi:signal transduction histidine kinase
VFTRDPERAGAELATVRRLAAEAADEVRAIVDGLRPVDLAGDGLDRALRKQVELLDRVHAASIRFSGKEVPRLAPDREQALYRIAQEALHNALRHGSPSSVDVRLAVHNGSVVLEIADDGNGFEPGRVDGATGGLGLASMRDRARAAGGHLAVVSRSGGGTTVRVEVPARG